MAFFKFRLRGQPTESIPTTGRRSAKNASAPTETIETLRRRARYRLIGAAVLVGVAVIIFPLLFDTQPRPVSMDVPITIPDRERVPPLEQPAAITHAGKVSSAASLGEGEEVVAQGAPHREAPVVSEAPPPLSRPDKLSEKPSEKVADHAPDKAVEKAAERSVEKPIEKPIEKPAPRPIEKPVEKVAEKPTERPAAKPESAPERKPEETRSRTEEAARARALLEGRTLEANAAKPEAKPPAAADAGRFIVQVGAFADVNSAREARAKADRAGVKTYTQEISTAQGKRIRVRVGPFATREDAEKAAAALKKSGLPGAVLAL
ncbi:SPOR domain-containing protein [Ottowia caeni]|uniref:SPOR domain-containing protein n=1 Tax=Ottowia caeni TaxID=2870339 RepID=UPI001E441CE5|nr:SPOR domain-containing protein [Ottowia caeni]